MELCACLENLRALPPWLLLLFSLGLLSTLKFSFAVLRWLYVSFLRPAKNLHARYGSWAVVTGPTDGIGKAFAFQLARRGLHLVLVGRNPDKLRDVSDAIRAKHAGCRIETVVIDFAGDLAEGVRRLREAIAGLDVGVLVNNAGMSYPYARFFHEVDEELMRNLIKVNVEGVTRVTHAVLPGMLERKRGAIVNIGSGAAIVIPSDPLYAVYAATKAFIDQFSRCLYVEYKNKGIDVQCQAYPDKIGPCGTVHCYLAGKNSNLIDSSLRLYNQGASLFKAFLHLKEVSTREQKIPLYVATKMASIKRSSFFVPSSDTYAHAALQWIGHEPRCTPYWPHSLLWCLLSMLPEVAIDKWRLGFCLGIRKRGQLKDAKKKEQ